MLAWIAVLESFEIVCLHHENARIARYYEYLECEQDGRAGHILFRIQKSDATRRGVKGKPQKFVVRLCCLIAVFGTKMLRVGLGALYGCVHKTVGRSMSHKNI